MKYLNIKKLAEVPGVARGKKIKNVEKNLKYLNLWNILIQEIS